MIRKCTHCRWKTETNFEQCQKCGRFLPEKDETKGVVEKRKVDEFELMEASDTNMIRKCTHCRWKTEANFKQCQKCGQILPTGANPCVVFCERVRPVFTASQVAGSIDESERYQLELSYKALGLPLNA